MEQASILYDNPRMSLRAHKELIEQVLEHKEDSALTEPRKDMVSGFSINDLGW